MPDLGIGEILIIAVVVMLLFGFKRLPDASRSIGRSLRIFKAETKGLREDDDKPDAPPAKTDYTQVPYDEPSALPARSRTLEEQRLEAQRFLDATAQQGSRSTAPPQPITPQPSPAQPSALRPPAADSSSRPR